MSLTELDVETWYKYAWFENIHKQKTWSYRIVLRYRVSFFSLLITNLMKLYKKRKIKGFFFIAPLFQTPVVMYDLKYVIG